MQFIREKDRKREIEIRVFNEVPQNQRDEINKR